MATMSRAWTLFTAVTVLSVQLCTGSKSCAIWCSAGTVVQRGSSFQMYCTFNYKCKGYMLSAHPPKRQRHEQLNSTTIYLNVTNITKNTTYSCQCERVRDDPCGLDISAGYLPERPENISCIYEVKDSERGVVSCSWNRGRDTFLWNSSALWVRTVYENHTDGPVENKVSTKGTGLSSASFTVSGSVQRISVWVEAQNALGSAMSIIVNYTLCDIAMPSTPALGQPRCSSRECIIQVERSVPTRHLEIQYRAEAHAWTSSPGSGVQARLVQERPVSSLEPYTLYSFRARSRFSTGLWSQWSADTSSRTQEEAPDKELDVWFAESSPDFKSLKVYWKEPSVSAARGWILGYRVRVDGRRSGSFIANLSADARSRSVPFCAGCEVTVWACNSRGPSPPARITARHTPVKLQPPQDVRVTADNLSVAICWREHNTAPLQAAYVVEWYPEGLKLEELSWVRLGRKDNHTVLTGIKPFECYEGAVHVFYNGSSVSRTRFTGVTTLTSAPTAGPSLQVAVEGNQATVTWTEIPRGQRGGCVTKYTIYLEIERKQLQHFALPASERTHVFKDLPPAGYSLWMTASTAEGEGRAGQKVNFFIQQETPVYPIVLCAVAALILVCLVCLCHISAVKQRLWVYFQCLMLDVVPDPANSKWAKECTQDKGKVMHLKLQLSDSSVAEEEDDPILVDVEELPKQSTTLLAPSPEPGPATGLYPLTNYIKSFSHDSDSSDHTHTSLDTNTTVDYISSHGLGNMEEEEEEEDEEEEEEEEFAGMMGFLPSHNIFIEPMEFGGKLTLNAVKIDCSDFFLAEQ